MLSVKWAGRTNILHTGRCSDSTEMRLTHFSLACSPQTGNFVTEIHADTDHREQNYFLNHVLGEHENCDSIMARAIIQHVEMLWNDPNRFLYWRWWCSLLKSAGLAPSTHEMNWWWFSTSSLHSVPLFLYPPLMCMLSPFLALEKKVQHSSITVTTTGSAESGS